MRYRHPDLFSDTLVDSTHWLPKQMFEYHLETLTSRKQEYQFEHFCRKLAEREICPNLRVQTGPTGGGDSKVDTETYPVAGRITERWWIGSPSAGAERWAFAFSAKKDWKPKVKADVKNILSTGRDYKLIYFFTNQFVSDKERSTNEDILSKEVEIPVHIIDRAWIVEKVYESDNRHIEAYFAALGVEDVRREKTARRGPRDTARLEELDKLDKQVSDPSNYQNARYQLVEDCLRSAILARSLERPRNEVDRRFAIADRIAQEVDYFQQRLRIAYNRAWTAYWWYEDYTECNHYYEKAEQYALTSVQSQDVGLLVNLWMLLLTSVNAELIDGRVSKISCRSRSLANVLETLAADSTRPNNALQARTSLILMRTTRALHDRNSNEENKAWQELTEVVEKSDNLGAYSVEHLFDLVGELGEYFDSPAFDALYDKLADVMRKRRSDGAAGIAYVKRAQQKMKHNRQYEAIQWFGRAEELLMKEEYREQLVTTLIGASYAYECAGLPWAARNKALAAVERSLATFIEEGQVISEALIALNRIVWIELRLGRIPHILDAITLANSIAAHLDLSEDHRIAYTEELQMQEWVLGIHLLNLPLEALPEVASLPSSLKRLELDSARMALLFALGHEQVLREEGCIPADEDAERVQTFFEQWQDQPAAEDISSRPVLVVGETSVLRSTILGIELAVETPNNSASFGVVESLLGALEAFLSTSDERHVFPYREHVSFNVKTSDQKEGTPQVHFIEDDSTKVKITHPVDYGVASIATGQEHSDWLQECLLKISCRFLMIRDVKAWLNRVIGEEHGLSRALNHNDSLTLNRNVFGKTPRIRLLDWIDKDDHKYQAIRNNSWRTSKSSASSIETGPPEFGTGPPPDAPNDRQKIRHTDRRVLSPIDIPLWDKAKWQGTAFIIFADEPPILSITFKDGKAGNTIFRAWKDRWGNGDADDALRLAIIKGVSKQNPAEYGVILGPSFQQFSGGQGKFILFVSRMQRMSPNSLKNLEKFVEAYNNAGRFFLAPVQLNPRNEISNLPSHQFAIAKRQLEIREAWQIGENDPDLVILREDDDPIIPDGVADPPVRKALSRKRDRRRMKN